MGTRDSWFGTSSRERNLLMTTIVVVLLGAGFVYVGEPAYSSWASSRSELLELRASLWELQNLAEHRTLIEDKFDDVKASISSGESIEAVGIGFLSEISQLANGVGIQVSSLKPLNAIQQGHFTKLSLQLHGACEHHQLVALLQVLQDPRHLVQCEEMVVTARNGRPSLTITLTLDKLVSIDTGNSR